uniref:hypothetical protein n=1 Tax=Altererythrobacter segetis TaxID=1104773 RepID=UPI001407D2B3|nr:hypothetical protein [Altererythrobacter segetis]
MKRRGRPEKPAEAIGIEAWQVWTFLDERIGAGWKLEAAVQAAVDHFGISRAQVFKHIDLSETVAMMFALRLGEDVDQEEAFAAVGLQGLLKRLIN